MEAYGIRGLPLQIFSSYLSDRYQAVSIKGTLSNYKLIETGVPQGSVLGPILYLIYVNELVKISNSCSICLFADDTTLIFSNSNKNDLISCCNTNLNIFYSWCCANRLSINISKTKFMLFSNVVQPSEIHNLRMNNIDIEHTDSIRFLGVILDENLKFNHHTNFISRKISQSCGILYKLQNILPQKHYCVCIAALWNVI